MPQGDYVPTGYKMHDPMGDSMTYSPLYTNTRVETLEATVQRLQADLAEAYRRIDANEDDDRTTAERVDDVTASNEDTTKQLVDMIMITNERLTLQRGVLEEILDSQEEGANQQALVGSTFDALRDENIDRKADIEAHEQILTDNYVIVSAHQDRLNEQQDIQTTNEENIDQALDRILALETYIAAGERHQEAIDEIDDDLFDNLERRIAALETRIATLEGSRYPAYPTYPHYPQIPSPWQQPVVTWGNDTETKDNT